MFVVSEHCDGFPCRSQQRCRVDDAGREILCGLAHEISRCNGVGKGGPCQEPLEAFEKFDRLFEGNSSSWDVGLSFIFWDEGQDRECAEITLGGRRATRITGAAPVS